MAELTDAQGKRLEVIDWNEIARRGLLERINREIMHPLGLSVFRVVETGQSGGAIVSDDGAWEYPRATSNQGDHE